MSYNPVNPNGQATSANSAPVVIASDQSSVPVTVQTGSNTLGSVKITDGTQTANTLASDTGQNALLTAGGRKETTFTGTSTGVDCSNYTWVSVQITAITSGTVTFQCSADNTNWSSVALQTAGNTTGTGGAAATTSTATGIYHGPIPARYFRVSFSGTSVSGIIDFFASPRTTLYLQTQSSSLTSSTLVNPSSSTGSAVPSTAFYNAGIAKTSLPSAATDGNLTGNMVDKFGRPVVINNTIRDLTGAQTTTISASTAETPIINAGATGVFNDLIAVMISNTSATAARVDIRDATAGGSVIFQIYVPAGDIRGLSLTTPWPQTTAANNWTAQSSASVTDLRVSALYAKNK